MELSRGYIVGLLGSVVFSLNLSLTDYHDPQANHILDAEVYGNTLIISAMVQGIEFYDISGNGSLVHLDHFTLGQGTKANCVEAINDYAYFTASNGLYVVNISNPSNPQNLGSVNGTNGLILENLDADGNFLAVAAHEDGVLLFDISNPNNLDLLFTIPSENAWGVRLQNGYAYIADDLNIKIYDVSNTENPTYLNMVETSNAVKDIAIIDSYMYVAIGSDGVNIYDLSNSELPIFLDNFDTNTMANRISPFDGKLAVSDWDNVDVLEWDGSNLNWVGYKNTGNRTMAIASKDNFIYSAEWASVQAFEFGEIASADIDLNTLELNYPFVNDGDSYSLYLEVINNGGSILIIEDDYTTNPHFEIVNELSQLQPGESQIVEIIYYASSLNSAGVYRIYTNDADEPLVMCETNGNIDGANIGELAIDFELDYVANGTGSFSLSDELGKIIVIAFFAPN
ncbi:MAG: hypothetical protein HOA66_04340 [Candidatus Marinimicrobia bacterium]|nr:hypothetical protein [Candidatus Neomarinimicrobiota bacterium]